MPNKYLSRLDSLILEYRSFTVNSFVNPVGGQASFDDLIWYHIDPNNGRKTRYLCGVHGVLGKGNAGDAIQYALPYPYSHLVKIWVIEIAGTAISSREKQSRVGVVRKLVSFMEGDLFLQTEVSLRKIDSGSHYADRLRSFLTFCSDKGLMPIIKFSVSQGRDRTGQVSLENSKDKLPDVKSIQALGKIYNKVFENVDAEGHLLSKAEINIHDALTITFVLLSLASPNRMAAEVTVLPKQQLQSYREGNGETVHFLDWKGSKGFGENRNHILSAMVGPATKAINFFYKFCEPARIICRFYENPKLSLGALLGDFKVNPELRKNISLKKRPTLFLLGYALGFYNKSERISVFKKAKNPSLIPHVNQNKYFLRKYIYSLSEDDQLSTASNHSVISSIPHLLGCSNIPQIFAGRSSVSVRELQEWWISYFRENLVPSFPVSFSTGESSICLKDAMFCFLGNWFYRRSGRGSGGKRLQSSPYAIVPLSSIGHSIIPRLTGNSSAVGAIFEDYGFSPELSLKPHSLRHFSNTLADMSGISVELITAWSGRKSIDQTHTYIHTTDQEKSERVISILTEKESGRDSIRLVAQQQIADGMNIPATLTSTGICAQDLNVSPCEYLNDFVSQCFLCPSSCYVAGDKRCIDLLERDLSFQIKRKESVLSDQRFYSSSAMKKWYVIHSRNIHILSLLVGLLKSNDKGSVIRHSTKYSEFSVVELETKVITKVGYDIPDYEEQARQLTHSPMPNSPLVPNQKLESMLSSFGITRE